MSRSTIEPESWGASSGGRTRIRGEGGEVMWSGKTLGRNPTTQWPAGDGLRLSVFRERVGGI